MVIEVNTVFTFGECNILLYNQIHYILSHRWRKRKQRVVGSIEVVRLSSRDNVYMDNRML